MESSIAESLWRQPACELLPTNFTNVGVSLEYRGRRGWLAAAVTRRSSGVSGGQVNLCMEGLGDLQKHCCFFHSQGERSKPSSHNHHSVHFKTHQSFAFY